MRRTGGWRRLAHEVSAAAPWRVAAVMETDASWCRGAGGERQVAGARQCKARQNLYPPVVGRAELSVYGL